MYCLNDSYKYTEIKDLINKIQESIKQKLRNEYKVIVKSFDTGCEISVINKDLVRLINSRETQDKDIYNTITQIKNEFKEELNKYKEISIYEDECNNDTIYYISYIIIEYKKL